MSKKNQARAQEALKTQAERRPWLAQACATLEDVEISKQSVVAACVVHRHSDLHVIKLLFVLTG